MSLSPSKQSELVNMKYVSILDPNKKTVSVTEAIINGQAPDGGLYVTTEFPEVKDYIGKSYEEIALAVLSLLLPEFSKNELADSIKQAYSELLPVKMNGNFLETFHGNTFSFKDLPLQLYPYLLKLAKEKQKVSLDTVILVATSGDTGPAVLAGAAHVPGLFSIVLFPNKGVSYEQRLQMVTQEGNVCSINITGNYDDAQRAVRALLADNEFKNQFAGEKHFTTAASINVARLLPQLTHFFWGYSEFVKAGKIKAGEQINFVVPSANFGNALSCFYAKQMGLPIKQAILATNENNVLYNFFKTGVYDKNREFKVTLSTAMDILHSTSLPRALYKIYGAEETIRACDELNKYGKFTVDKSKLGFFYPGGFTTDEQTMERIKVVYDESGYLMDPHTAVAESVYHRYQKETGDETPSIIISTASPYKFVDIVERAIGKKLPPAPPRILELYKKEVIHNRSVKSAELDAIKAEITEVLS